MRANQIAASIASRSSRRGQRGRRICSRRSTRSLRSVASWRHLPTIAPQSRQKNAASRAHDRYQRQPRRSCLREAGRFSSLVSTRTRIGIRCSGPADASPTSKMNSRRLILCPSEVLTSIVSAPTIFKEGRSGLRRGSSVSFESFSDLGPRAELGSVPPSTADMRRWHGRVQKGPTGDIARWSEMRGRP
jgi:hypothetical protein